MNKINVLDVTLRDGGIANHFNFGQKNMLKILHSLEDSGVEFIELGYLEQNTGSYKDRSQYISEDAIYDNFLKEKKSGIKYVVMFDYGKFDVDKISSRTEHSVDGIRFAFHKRNLHDVKPIYEKLIAKGYDVFMQPMVTLHYSDEELNELIDIANSLDLKGFYFVDTFGQMVEKDVVKLAKFFDNRLNKKFALGFHSHNNIQMAYANSIQFLKLETERPLMLDCSIYGMGRGAGNLNTELLMDYLNHNSNKQYNICPLLNVIDSCLNLIKAKNPWGYSIEYYLSSINDCSPIYANHYYEKHMLPVENINELLKTITGEQRISFNLDYAEEMYRKYNSNKEIDDSKDVEKLEKLVKGKKILLVAPGSSINSYYDEIQKTREETDLCISLNFNFSLANIVFVSRLGVDLVDLNKDQEVISVSNVSDVKSNFIIDYSKWITIDKYTRDSAGYIIIKLLAALGAKRIYLAGFDGFRDRTELNYFSDDFERVISREQTKMKNSDFKQFLQKYEKLLIYVTPSKYSEI